MKKNILPFVMRSSLALSLTVQSSFAMEEPFDNPFDLFAYSFDPVFDSVPFDVNYPNALSANIPIQIVNMPQYEDIQNQPYGVIEQEFFDISGTNLNTKQPKMTEEQKGAKREFRAKMTEEQKEHKREYDRERYAKMTEEHKEHKRERERGYQREYRAKMTEEHKEHKRGRERGYQREFRAKMTEEQKEHKREYDREYRANKTEQQKERERERRSKVTQQKKRKYQNDGDTTQSKKKKR